MENSFHVTDTSSVTSDQWISLTHIFALLSIPAFAHLPSVVNYLGCPISSRNLPLRGCAQSQGAPGFHLHETFLFSFIYLGSVSFEGSYHCTSVWKRKKKNSKRKSTWSVTEVVLLQVNVSKCKCFKIICIMVIVFCIFSLQSLQNFFSNTKWVRQVLVIFARHWHSDVKLNIIQGFKESFQGLWHLIIMMSDN